MATQKVSRYGLAKHQKDVERAVNQFTHVRQPKVIHRSTNEIPRLWEQANPIIERNTMLRFPKNSILENNPEMGGKELTKESKNKRPFIAASSKVEAHKFKKRFVKERFHQKKPPTHDIDPMLAISPSAKNPFFTHKKNPSKKYEKGRQSVPLGVTKPIFKKRKKG